jgi:hypothetical protein
MKAPVINTRNDTQAALNSGGVDGFSSGVKGRQRARVPDWVVRLLGDILCCY